ncbi:hypothetical protein EAF04_006927 [Stromatinia cepivora]|nr:hypothetical protein EAF04_006927 [Stromatinia cepivora]
MQKVVFKTPLSKPLAVYICHCNECKRQSSSAFGASAIFPRFPLPRPEFLAVYTFVFLYLFPFPSPPQIPPPPHKKLITPPPPSKSRPTASGHTVNCYFCKACGTRLIHSTPEKNVVSVKGGCIEGLDWKMAKHIWVKRAMVPIPAGAEASEEEPEHDPYICKTEDLRENETMEAGAA